MTNIYQEHGYKNRKDYLLSLAIDYDIEPSIVFTLANLLGESEDFDGLIVALEDYIEMEGGF